MKKRIPILLVALLLAVGLALPAAGIADADNDNGPYTPGMWKTHSQYGPAPYHCTWDGKDGGDAPFFGTGFSYYEVLHIPPKGQAYFILAHQYIAAELNMLNGASMSLDVLDAWEEAGELLVKYEAKVSIPKKGEDRALAIQLYELLDDYNNGLIGPGHCSE